MLCSKSGNGRRPSKLCPLSFGLAVGIVCFFAVLIWTLWAMSYGVPPMMAAVHIPDPTLSGGIVHGLLALVKGFLFGFFVALLYDLISGCCKKSCESSECESSPEKKK